MGIGLILVIVLLVLMFGAIPSWPHSKNWGYGPTGGLSFVLVIIVVMMFMGRI